MAEIIHHKLEEIERVEGEGKVKAGHLHSNFASDASFDNGTSKSTLLFSGTSIVVYVEGRDGSHFHLDITQELEDLVEAIEAGKYDD